MPDYNVIVSQEAKTQLKQIAEYIAFELLAPQAAQNLLTELEQAMASLDTFPNRIPLCPETPWQKHGIHSMVVKNYLIYFSIDDSAKAVNILAVVYGKRNQVDFLKKI